MFNKFKYKSHLYKLFYNNQIKICPSTKISILHFYFKKKYFMTTGNSIFYQKKLNVVFLNKPFFFLIITKKPKAYPFKIIKI